MIPFESLTFSVGGSPVESRGDSLKRVLDSFRRALHEEMVLPVRSEIGTFL